MWGRLLLAEKEKVFTFQWRLDFPRTHTLRDILAVGWSGRVLPPWMIGLTAKGHSLLEETISSPTSIERRKFLSLWPSLMVAGCSLFFPLLCFALEKNSNTFVDEVSQTESSDFFFVPIHQLLNGLWNCLEQLFACLHLPATEVGSPQI